MKHSILLHTAAFLLSLILNVVLSHRSTAQETGQIKEPPIPVVIGKEHGITVPRDAQNVILTISDFNYLVARQDSLAKQTSQLSLELRSRSFLIYVLIVGLFLSNVASISIVRKHGESGRE